MSANDLSTTPDNPRKNRSQAISAMLSREERFLNQVERIIMDNLDNQEFVVPDLAQALELSVSQLNRRLNSLIDHSAGQFIRKLRLEYAAKCLSRNVASIKLIARMTGYKNQAHFCRTFKLQYGCSPSEFTHKNR